MKTLFVVIALLWAAGARAETFTDSAGRRVELPARVSKVLAAGPPAAVMLYTLAPEKLLGWTRAPDSEALAYLPAPFGGVPTGPRLTGRDPADPAAVKALGADLIVDFGTVNAAYAEIADRMQAATGIPYVLLDGAMARTSASYKALATVMQAARGDSLATRSGAMLDDVATRLAGVSPKRLYVARGPDGTESYGAGGFTDDMMRPTGAENVAAAWGRGNLKGIAPEKVREAAPDVIVATDPYFLDVVAKTPAWQAVPAIAGGRIFLAPRHPWGWIDEPPSVNRLIGVRWLAGLLHPDRFGNTLRSEVRDFYQRFYHADLDDVRLDALMARAVQPRR